MGMGDLGVHGDIQSVADKVTVLDVHDVKIRIVLRIDGLGFFPFSDRFLMFWRPDGFVDQDVYFFIFIGRFVVKGSF